MLPRRWRKPAPVPPSGRLLESRREARHRGMIAAACRPFHGRMAHRIRLTGPSAKNLFFYRPLTPRARRQAFQRWCAERRAIYFFTGAAAAAGGGGIEGGLASTVFTAGEVVAAFESRALTFAKCVSLRRAFTPGGQD